MIQKYKFISAATDITRKGPKAQRPTRNQNRQWPSTEKETKRWIVEDRPDGANVHNWHWAEKDCLEWSRNLLCKLLNNLKVLDGEGNLFIKINKVEKVEGEAYVNVRKGKIIPGYELNVVLSWQGEAKDSEGNSLLKVDGSVEIPYISDENADEDPEIRVTVKDEGPIGKTLKDAMFSKGKAGGGGKG
ncbi:hypothetical protein OIU77_017815 [Salix suchowensis]|uniref:Activator of Hsp90 ATPase AHSA1-like N-terminal domain-containing protein n=1 Tax=Salix suchowensis TaxID=1278906 RepID=A0ABQ8ZQN2_9ROSI|nr:hypothetical protein OIU77_017815 [Salix suchowensis]